MSKKHCEINLLGPKAYLRDLKSTNKTYLNGEVVSVSKVVLSQNDVIVLGNQKYIFSNTNNLNDITFEQKPEPKVDLAPKSAPAPETASPVDLPPDKHESTKTESREEGILDRIPGGSLLREASFSLKVFLVIVWGLIGLMGIYCITGFSNGVGHSEAGQLSFVIISQGVTIGITLLLTYALIYAEARTIKSDEKELIQLIKRIVERGLFSFLLVVFLVIFGAFFLAKHPYAKFTNWESLKQKCSDKKIKSCYKLGGLNFKKGNKVEALKLYNLGCDVGHSRSCNGAAWLYVTEPDLVNAEEGLKLALKAVSFSKKKYTSHYDTLAVAYAENGNFSKAIEVGEMVFKKSSSKKYREIYSRHLQMFKQGKTYLQSKGSSDGL